MAEQFKFAGMDGADEVTISLIHVKVGQEVKVGDNLFDVEADKASDTITSTISGLVSKINFKPGDTIKIGDTIIEFGGASANSIGTKDKEEKSTESTNVEKTPLKTKNTSEFIANSTVLATPLARKVARDLGVDITHVKGTGPNSRVLRSDVENSRAPISAISNGAKASPSIHTVGYTVPPINVSKIESFGPVDHLPLTGIRKAVANAMSASVYTAPHVSLMVDVDATNLINLRSVMKEQAIKPENGAIKLTFMPFFIKAIAKALSEDRFKLLNSTINIAGNEILVKKYYNIGMAADTDKGLVVPIIKNADKIDLLSVAKEVNALAVKARKGELKAEEMQGGTFTITNFGSAGLKYGTPVINYPEVAILGLGALETKAVFVNGLITFHQFFPLSISIDHRVVDGAPAGYFMTRIKELIENPALIFA